MTTALEVRGVSFAYGRASVLTDVSIEVERGAIVGILGPNGSGKTTLLRLLSGVLTPNRGAVTVDGAAVASLSRQQIARRIAVVPQETHATFDFTALDIVLMGRYPHLGAFELEGVDDLRIAREALAATRTSEFESRPFATLSGGEKQRVVIAGALAQAADVLLLDEPTASLDLGFQLDIVDLLARLNRERGVTMVVSTHDLNLAATLCSRLVMLRKGRVLAAGATRDVLTPDHVRELYGVNAHISVHPLTQHLTVIPTGRAQ